MNNITTRKATPQEQAYLDRIYGLTKNQEKLMQDYDIYFYHSGGGCRHFAFDLNITDTNGDDVFWYINSESEKRQIPIKENEKCSFYLYYDNCSDQIIKIIDQIAKIHSEEKDCDKEHIPNFFIYDTLKNGVPKMKAITKEIETLIKGEK
tara:strand:- start:3134 stop:3583 length:450 start_codon:yes stop_codon:yes gene_type:complete